MSGLASFFGSSAQDQAFYTQLNSAISLYYKNIELRSGEPSRTTFPDVKTLRKTFSWRVNARIHSPDLGCREQTWPAVARHLGFPNTKLVSSRKAFYFVHRNGKDTQLLKYYVLWHPSVIV